MADLLGKPNHRQANHYDCTICGSERIRTDNRKSHKCYKGDFHIFRKCIQILGNIRTKGGDNQRTGRALFGDRVHASALEPKTVIVASQSVNDVDEQQIGTQIKTVDVKTQVNIQECHQSLHKELHPLQKLINDLYSKALPTSKASDTSKHFPSEQSSTTGHNQVGLQSTQNYTIKSGHSREICVPLLVDGVSNFKSIEKPDSGACQVCHHLQTQLEKQETLFKEQLEQNKASQKERLQLERQNLEEVRHNDVKRLEEKYECLLQEVRERTERAETQLKQQKEEFQFQIWELKKDHKEQLGRLDTLFNHHLQFLPKDKQGEANQQRKSATSQNSDTNPVTEAEAQMYDTCSQQNIYEYEYFEQVQHKGLGFTSCQQSVAAQDTEQPFPTQKAIYSKNKAARMLPKYDGHYQKILGKHTNKVVSTPNGSNVVLKELRKQQSQLIFNTLENVKHLVPTIKEILDPVWQRHSKQNHIDLKAVGRKKVFCDGIGIPKIAGTTETGDQIRKLFARFDLKLQVIVAKDEQWFVKLDEDAMSKFSVTKKRLRELSNTAHENQQGRHDFYLLQVDKTRDQKGFMYCQDVENAIKRLGKLGLKKYRGYHSSSLSLNLEFKAGHRVKIYNKTMHPLFATDSVFKRIGTGARQFFLSSNYSFATFRDSIETSRFRIEESFYFKSKDEERNWFEQEDLEEDDFIKALLKHLRTEGTEFIKEIPFDEIWNAFWYVQKAHIFVEESHKAAVIYAFNEETQQYIGGFLDLTRKKDMELFHREHSISNREALVMKGGNVTQRFVKKTNKHCFPIFPRFNPRTHQRHQIIIPGWDYYMDTNDVELNELEVPIPTEEIEESLVSSNSQVLPPKITVQQFIDGGLEAKVAQDLSREDMSQEEAIPQFPQQAPKAKKIMLQNNRPVFSAQQRKQKVEERRRAQKEETKRIAKAAKEQGRANRDDDMDFFAAYYKEKFMGVKFIELKRFKMHPKQILGVFNDSQLVLRAQKFVNHQRERNKI